MQFVRIISSHRPYVQQFYEARQGLEQRSFAEQKRAYDEDHFVWGDGLKVAMEGLGHTVLEIDVGMEPMVRAWAKEHAGGMKDGSIEEIVLHQVSKFGAEAIMFDCGNVRLLKMLREPGVRLIFGWEGSALGLGQGWTHLDFILSCAPESVERLRGLGHKAEHMNHAFDYRVNSRLVDRPTAFPVSFIGSITRRDAYHLERERILLKLGKSLPLQIYSPSVSASMRDYAKAAACAGIFVISKALDQAHLRSLVSRKSAVCARWLRLSSAPRLPINRKLARLSRPAVYGLAYYQVMKDSLISLNIHADSSPQFASNIRLFEATGVGSCLLTDWRPNLSSLFDLDHEVVAYKTADECLEKARWLLDHPVERAEIARRGQQRVLREYTFEHRALQLDSLLKRYLARAPKG